jgi:hypothetical protein
LFWVAILLGFLIVFGNILTITLSSGGSAFGNNGVTCEYDVPVLPTQQRKQQSPGHNNSSTQSSIAIGNRNVLLEVVGDRSIRVSTGSSSIYLSVQDNNIISSSSLVAGNDDGDDDHAEFTIRDRKKAVIPKEDVNDRISSTAGKHSGMDHSIQSTITTANHLYFSIGNSPIRVSVEDGGNDENSSTIRLLVGDSTISLSIVGNNNITINPSSSVGSNSTTGTFDQEEPDATRTGNLIIVGNSLENQPPPTITPRSRYDSSDATVMASALGKLAVEKGTKSNIIRPFRRFVGSLRRTGFNGTMYV